MKPPRRKVSVKETDKMLHKIKNNTFTFLKIVVYRETRSRKRVLLARSAREKMIKRGLTVTYSNFDSKTM